MHHIYARQGAPGINNIHDKLAHSHTLQVELQQKIMIQPTAYLPQCQKLSTRACQKTAIAKKPSDTTCLDSFMLSLTPPNYDVAALRRSYHVTCTARHDIDNMCQPHPPTGDGVMMALSCTLSYAQTPCPNHIAAYPAVPLCHLRNMQRHAMKLLAPQHCDSFHQYLQRNNHGDRMSINMCSVQLAAAPQTTPTTTLQRTQMMLPIAPHRPLQHPGHRPSTRPTVWHHKHQIVPLLQARPVPARHPCQPRACCQLLCGQHQ
jgi:hypothetical protein